MRKVLALLGILSVIYLPAKAQIAYTFVPIVVIAGTSIWDGTTYAVDGPTGIRTPFRTTLQVILAKEVTYKVPYGKLSTLDTAFNAFSNSTASANWTLITSTSATFKFRASFKTLSDWLVFKVNAVRDDPANPLKTTKWKVDRTYTDTYGNIEATLPTIYFQSGDIAITP